MHVEITILKVVKADHFWAKETPGTMMSEETRKFQELSQQINDFFSTDQAICVPAQGQLCVGKRPADRMWYRVRVKTILQSKSGPQACCFLLDYAEDCLIPCHWLRQAPPQFMQLAWQAKEFCLYGLQPLTLITSIEDFTTTQQPCKKYDTSANEYVSKLVKESYGASVHVYHVDRDTGVHHVILYLKRTTGTVCVNDDLVSKEYAKYSEDEEVKSNLRMLSPLFSPSVASAGHVSPQSTSPPPLSPDPSQRSSPCSGLAAMLGLNPMIVTEPAQMTPTPNTQPQAASEIEQQTGTGMPNNSNSPVSPGAAAFEFSRLAIDSPDGMKTKVSSPAEQNGEMLYQQMSALHSAKTSPSVSVREKESGHGLEKRQGTSKSTGTLNDPSLKPAGKNLSPRKILKAARSLQPSSGRIIENGSIAVNAEWLKGNSGQETKWIPGVSPPMNDKSSQPVLGGQEVKNMRSFPPDQVKLSGHSVQKEDEVISRSSRSVESRLNAAYSQTSTLGKEWTQLAEKTRPVRQRSLSPIPVHVGAARSGARSPPMQGGKDISQSVRVSSESISTAGVFDGATSGHASTEMSAHGKSTGMSGSDMCSTGQSEQTQAAVMGNSAGRHDDISGSNTSQASSSDGATKSDAKAEGSRTTGAEAAFSGGDDVTTTTTSTPSAHTGYTPARLPRINLHGNPLRDR